MIRRALARAVAAVTERARYLRALRPAPGLPDAFEAWLVAMSSSLDPDTIRTYRRTYVKKHWMPFFKTMARVRDEAVLADYMRLRLGKVLKKTTQKELSALRGFLVWCEEQGHIRKVPEFPSLPRKATGVRSGRQRAKAPEHSQEQVRAAIAAMPAYSKRGGFPVRARCLVAYETGLRPATLDALTWAMLDLEKLELTLSAEGDKARYGRTVPISELARDALLELRGDATTTALIFGRHDYRGHLKKAARAAGMKSLSPYDFRHSRATHLLDDGAPLNGVAELLGHLQMTTTNKYARGSRKAANRALAAAASVAAAGLSPPDVVRVMAAARAEEAGASAVDESVPADDAARRSA